MTDVEFDTSDMRRFIESLDRIPVAAHKEMTGVVKDSLRDLRNEWRDNARLTAGTHGNSPNKGKASYVRTITDEVLGDGWVGVVGPESALPQGGMGPGFEYGGQNQKPHFDGNIAADTIAPRFNRRVSIAASGVFRGL